MKTIRFKKFLFFFGLTGVSMYGIGFLEKLSTNEDFEVRADKFDFGIIPKGELVEAYFDLKSIGNQSVQLIGAEIPCSCTTSSGFPLTISSNSWCRFVLRIDTKNLELGKFREQVQLFSTSHSRPRQRLFVIGDIVK